MGCGAFVIAKKLKQLKARLREWAKFCFGSIKLKKLALLNEIESLDLIKENRLLTEEEGSRESEVQLALNSLLKQEELYWKQCSRVKWIKEGDENTKFFHAFANGRRNRNFIPRIRDGNFFCGRI